MFLLYLLFHGHSVCLTSPEAFLPECMKLPPPPTLKKKIWREGGPQNDAGVPPGVGGLQPGKARGAGETATGNTLPCMCGSDRSSSLATTAGNTLPLSFRSP